MTEDYDTPADRLGAAIAAAKVEGIDTTALEARMPGLDPQGRTFEQRRIDFAKEAMERRSADDAAMRLIRHRGSGELGQVLDLCRRMIDETADPGWTVAGLSSRFKITKGEVRLIVYGRIY